MRWRSAHSLAIAQLRPRHHRLLRFWAILSITERNKIVYNHWPQHSIWRHRTNSAQSEPRWTPTTARTAWKESIAHSKPRLPTYVLHFLLSNLVPCFSSLRWPLHKEDSSRWTSASTQLIALSISMQESRRLRSWASNQQIQALVRSSFLQTMTAPWTSSSSSRRLTTSRRMMSK